MTAQKWKIPFTRPNISEREEKYVIEALRSGALAGGGDYTARCQSRLSEITGADSVLLTQSCTAALEMAAILANVGPGDEVILPSYTFVSTANAFVLRGATPVFVDIQPDTLNIDPTSVHNSVTDRTRAIVPVHYAGVGCNIDAILKIAQQYNLIVIEDAAQGILSKWQGRHLGTFGDLGALSFHNTKNLSSGEGGALLINNQRFQKRAGILWEKGTNRSLFMRGEVDKYSWVDVGSSFLPSELTAACLLGQLERAEEITRQRLNIWQAYDDKLRSFCEDKGIKLPHVPFEVQHNAHMYYLIARNTDEQDVLLNEIRKHSIQAVFHYIPLHSSYAGKRFGRAFNPLPITEDYYKRVIRLPLWSGMTEQDVTYVVECIQGILSKSCLNR